MQGKRRTVLRQVLFSYAVITLSFALVAGYNVLGQRRSVREIELVRSGYLPLALALRDAMDVQNTYNTQLNHITDVPNPADKQEWFDHTLNVGRPRVFAAVRAALTRAFGTQDTLLRNELSTELGQIERFVREDRELLTSLFEALKRSERATAEATNDNLVTRGTRAAAMLGQLETRVTVQVDNLIEAASQRERLNLRLLLVWVGFTVFLGVGVALYARRLLRPLEQVTERAKVVAGGDFTPQAPHTSTNEIGELSRTFEAMVAEIARVNHELLESERLATIGKMAAHVTHEVRNPLSSIALNLELLEEELPQESEAHTLFIAIRKEVERLTELTEQYLTVARRRDPNFAIEDLAEVVAEAVEFMSPELKRHEVAIAADFGSELPPVKLDEGQIRQVMHNLLRNARQAMPNGGNLRVTVASSAEPGWVDIDVSDTGAGMSEETRARLFEPFFTTRSHGTGLGLAISRHIVEAHGGVIRCEPNEPHGTRFVVRLPVAGSGATAHPPVGVA